MITFTMLSTSLQMHAEHGSDEDIFKISVQDTYLDLFQVAYFGSFKIQKNPNGLAIICWCRDHFPCGSQFLHRVCLHTTLCICACTG